MLLKQVTRAGELAADRASVRGFLNERRRVLMAGDLAPVLSAVEALLRESFEIVGMVSDGQTALESTMKQEPDLVVLDISMPGMGRKGTQEARQSCQDRIPHRS
jgi:CheY-like chemotaxis protein